MICFTESHFLGGLAGLAMIFFLLIGHSAAPNPANLPRIEQKKLLLEVF